MHQHILLEAHQIIHGERKKTYGDGTNGMQGVAEQWSLYLNQKYGFEQLCAEDVCWMLADLKKFRQMHKSKRDNVVDAAGYVGLIDSILAEDFGGSLKAQRGGGINNAAHLKAGVSSTSSIG